MTVHSCYGALEIVGVRVGTVWGVEPPTQFMSTDTHLWVKIGYKFQSLGKISNISATGPPSSFRSVPTLAGIIVLTILLLFVPSCFGYSILLAQLHGYIVIYCWGSFVVLRCFALVAFSGLFLVSIVLTSLLSCIYQRDHVINCKQSRVVQYRYRIVGPICYQPPFRPSDPALCGSRPLVTPY